VIRRVARLSLAAALGLATLPALAATDVAQVDPSRRDEFGLKPDDGSDKELLLPDPVLDRSWPVPGPGAEPPAFAPDEDETDPFKDETAPPPPDKDAPAPSEAEKPALPARPLVGPDGRLDAGSPSAEPDPVLSDILEPEIDEPSEIDREDNAPSPLDRGDTDFHNETGDPGEW
jgi:hypothetical protein